MGQVDGGHRAGSRIEDRLDDAHLKGIHDASHVVGFLEVEDRCIWWKLVTNPGLASAQN